MVAGLATALILAPGMAPPAEARDTRPRLGWSTNTIALTDWTEATTGLAPAVLSTYTPFSEPFPSAWAAEAVRRGVPLVVSWEPWDWNRPVGTEQPEYSLAGIAAGRHDPYVREWARAAAASGASIMLRFAAEMNGDWHPWSKGERPAEFVAAWRHLHRMVEQEGAANVRWVFNPVVHFAGATPVRAFWPGSAYVDWLGVDGYNWYGVLPNRRYETVDEVFGETIQLLRELDPRLPIMIAECGAGPAAKDRWIPDLMRTAPRLGVSLVVWFEHDKETDWRMTTASLRRPLPSLMRGQGWRIPG